MSLAFNSFAFLFGLAIGSFLNSLVLRFNTGEKISQGRSRCFSCAKKLGPWELIPVVSYVLLRGRCSSCRSFISWQYPLGEILCGILFLLAFIRWDKVYPESPAVLAYWFLEIAILVAIVMYDFRHKIIPDAFSYSFLLIALIENLFLFRINLFDLLLSLLPALFLFLLWLYSRGRWMGLGDAKLAAGMGVFLGYPLIVTSFILSFWIGGIVGITLLLASRKITLKSEIPFGPFLAAGFLITFFFSDFFITLRIFYV
jgi:leader peptidase (prepilin peptidase)/N-methyltransferase